VHLERSCQLPRAGDPFPAEAKIFERLIALIATLPERSDEGWVLPSERIIKPLSPDKLHGVDPASAEFIVLCIRAEDGREE
jgi:hypothetical protein